jgi:hypothetical protein
MLQIKYSNEKMNGGDNLLIIFVRPPVKGKVKTRLADSIGAFKALSVYKKLLLHTKQVALACPADKCVAYSENIETKDIWDSRNFQKMTQEGDDLGKRMHNAFVRGFANSYNHVCLIGSDIFELTTNILNTAFTYLQTHDLVIGPASDGGYYLIGMNKPNEFLFQDIPWSTGEVLLKTLERARQLELRSIFLKELNDIDDIEDIKPEDRDNLLS